MSTETPMNAGMPPIDEQAKRTAPEVQDRIAFRERLSEWVDVVHERIGARPLHLVVFAAALGVLGLLHSGSRGTLLVPAVGYAPNMEHPSPAATWVDQVFVLPGDRVEKGAPLLTLATTLIEREIAVIDAGIDRLHKEAEMNLSRLSQEYVDKQLSLQGQLDDSARAKARAKALEERMRRLSDATGTLRERLNERLQDRTARVEDLEKTELMHETYVATAEEASLLARSEDDLARGLRRRLESRPELIKLSETMLAYYEASIRELQEQRNGLMDALRQSTVLARASGRVEYVLPAGASAALGMPVAAIVPDHASEIVAYLPARTNPLEFTPGAKAVITAAGCPAEGTLKRTGGNVVEAPLHLQTRLFTSVFGLPAYISVPEECRIGVGQTLSVQLERARL